MSGVLISKRPILNEIITNLIGLYRSAQWSKKQLRCVGVRTYAERGMSGLATFGGLEKDNIRVRITHVLSQDDCQADFMMLSR